MRTADPVCRLAWRPSSWEAGGVLLLGACAVVGVFASDLAFGWRLAVATVAGVWAVVRARGLRRRRVRRLVVASVATLDGVPVEVCRLAWRGPMAFVVVRAACGRLHRLAWGPGTLTMRQRRTLRLAVDPLAHAATPR